MKHLLLLVAVVLLALPAEADNYRMMQVEKLPRGAQELLMQHFPGQQVSYAASDRALFNKGYKVFFSDGATIEFDRHGAWTEIDGNENTVPVALIPGEILREVRKRFSGDPIVKVERSRKGYELELRSGIELQFNSRNELIHIDD